MSDRASSFFQALNTLERSSYATEQTAQLQLEGLRRQHKYLEQIALQLTSESLDSEQAQQIVRSLRVFEQGTQGYIQSLSKSAAAQTAAYQRQQEAFHDQIVLLELLSFGLIILLLTAQFYCLLRPVTQALRRLQIGAERIDLTPTQSDVAHIDIDTDDELQALAKSFNQMSDRLRSSYQNLEVRVAERTASLHRANQSLLEEVSERLEVEASLRQAMAQLKQTQLQLMQTEKNVELRAVGRRCRA